MKAGGGGTATGLGPSVKHPELPPFCELGPSVNTLFSQIHHVPRLPILSGSQLGSSMYYCVTVFKHNLNRNVIFKNYNMVARVVSGFHQLSYFQLHCGGARGGDGLHEHNLVV